MAAVGWSANPYLALIDPSMRYGGPSPEMMYPQEQAPQQTGAATTGGFDTLAGSPYVSDPTEGGFSDPGMGPEVAGPMTSLESQQARDITGFPGAQVANAMFGDDPSMGKSMARGLTNAGLGIGAQAVGAPIGGMAKAPAGFMGLLSNMLSMPGVRNMLGWGMERSLMSPSAVDMQGMADRYGYGMPSPLGDTPSSPIGGVDMGVTQGALAGVNQAPGDVQGGGNGPGGNTDGTSPGGSAEAGGGEAKGGVHRTQRGFSRLSRYGEAGPEEAIFIPQRGARHDMTKPGIQGNERQVKKALSSNLKKLRG